MQRMRRHLVLLAFLVALVPVLAQAVGGTTPGTAGSCPTGTVPITDATREQAKAAGIPDSSACWDPKSQYTGADAGAAKQFLITRYDPGSASSVGLSNAKTEGIERLDSNFAVQLAKMMKAAPMELRIISAYRSCAGQLQANPRGYGGDCSRAPHTKGIAVDFNYGKNDCSGAAHNWVQSNAAQYGLGLYNQLHSYVSGECNHIELASGKSTSPGTTGSGTTASSPYGQAAPLGYGQGAVNSAQGPCPSGYVFYNNQCYALSNSQPLGAAQQPFQPSQPMQTGQPAGIGQPSYPSTPVSPGTGGTVGTPNTNTGSNTGTGSTNNLNLVESIISGTSTATGTIVGTASTFTSDTLSSTGSYGNGAPASDTLLNTATNAATNTLTIDQLTSSQGTFSTTDIGTAVDITASSSSQSFLRVALENLRRRLVYLLEVLGLMRRGAPAQEIHDLPLPQLLPPPELGAQEGGGD